MGRTACTEPQCLYKGALYLTSVPVQVCTLPFLFFHFEFSAKEWSVNDTKIMHHFMLPPQCKRDYVLLRCYTAWIGSYRRFRTTSRSRLQGSSSPRRMSSPENGSDRFSRNVLNHLPCITSQKMEDLRTELWYSPVEIWWHTVTHGRGVKGKLANWVGSQYSSH